MRPVRSSALTLLVVALAAGCAGSSRTGTEALTILPGIHHVGDDYVQEYPEAAKAEGLHVRGAFDIQDLPRKARLTVESADVDLEGCEIWINAKRVGDFTVNREWHTDTFDVPRGILREGHNEIMVRSKVWSASQAEDFFFRNAQLVLEY
ncbi:MAG: hypothetical protein JXB04_12920 [Kiritimatiellae bacterium]|nr:hypothetical protein [Kiritimatiellia bacterium]